MKKIIIISSVIVIGVFSYMQYEIHSLKMQVAFHDQAFQAINKNFASAVISVIQDAMKNQK